MTKLSQAFSKSPEAPCATCAIRPITLYAGISSANIDWLNSHRLGFREVRARRTILRQGDVPDEIYTIFSGWAFRYKQLADGRRQILSFLLPGNMVAPQAMFSEPLRFSVMAKTSVLLCRFRVADMRKLVASNEILREEVLARSFHYSSMLDERLTDLGRRNAEGRILRLLLEIHKRQARRNAIDADGGCEFPLHQEDIADALGLTTVHVSRTLKTLRKKGLMVLKQGRLILPDIDAAHATVERI